MNIKEKDVGAKMNSLLGTMRDVAAKESVEIRIQKDGLVAWINIDGVCVLRVMTNGIIPIEIEDDRKS